MRAERADLGRKRLPGELVRVVEGMALARPPPSAATIHRRLADLAYERGWPLPAARTVRAIVAAIDPTIRTLAHEGPAAYRDRYELIHRHRADLPNAFWQCDHTERLFGTINTELLGDLPGRLVGGRPVTPPKLTLSQLDAAVGAFVVGRHNARQHAAIGAAPQTAWTGMDGFLACLNDWRISTSFSPW